MIPYQRFTPHPMTDRDYWERVRTDPALAPWREAQAAVIRDAPPVPPPTLASDYLATGRHRDRSRLDYLCFHTRTVLSSLAMRRAMLGLDPNDPDDLLLNWLWACLTEACWSFANHCAWRELPPERLISIDLQSCEMSAMLAELLETLRPWVDSVSTTLADSIIRHIDHRVLDAYGAGHRSPWEEHRPVNNWFGVCSGTLLTACESLAAQGHPRPAARARALGGLRQYLDDCFTPSGECDEGVGYWTYGMTYASTGWSRLTKEELAASVDMDRFRTVAGYPQRAHLFGDDFYAGNDSGTRCRPAWSFVPWLASAADDEWLADWASASASAPPEPLRDFSTAIRDLDARVRFHTDAVASAPAPPAGHDPARLLVDQQAAILRTATPAGELLATLVGGHNDERHNHNHLGHFQVALAERIILPDFGPPQPYPADFFSARRYQYLSASSRGHSCPLIDGHEQRAGREAAGRIVSWQPDGDGPHLQLDLTSAYPPEAGLQLWMRRLECERPAGVMALTDEYRTSPPRPVTHVFWSVEPPSLVGEGTEACGIALGEALMIVVTPAPSSAVEITGVQADEHGLKKFAGQTLYRVGLIYPPEAVRRIVTRISPRA